MSPNHSVKPHTELEYFGVKILFYMNYASKESQKALEKASQM